MVRRLFHGSPDYQHILTSQLSMRILDKKFLDCATHSVDAYIKRTQMALGKEKGNYSFQEDLIS